MKTIMTIAGFDPSAGAGVLADIKTISAFGCYGIGVVTSLTVQNTLGVTGVVNHPPALVRDQMESLFEDFDIAAVKIGMLPGPQIVAEVVRVLSTRAIEFVVLDPIFRSTSGFQLGVADRDSLRPLLKLASVVTPNVDEALWLAGGSIAKEADMKTIATAILGLGARAVLITGGDVPAETATDFLMDPPGIRTFSAPSIKSRNTHGTGCALSSAIACLLAMGEALPVAVEKAKAYVARGIRSAPGLGRGHGPINHFNTDHFEKFWS